MAAAGNFMTLSTGAAVEDVLTALRLIIHPRLFELQLVATLMLLWALTQIKKPYFFSKWP